MKILKWLGYLAVWFAAGYFAAIEFFRMYQSTGDIGSAIAAWMGIMTGVGIGLFFYSKKNTAKGKNETD